MSDTQLVILAAGMGSRFGGMKQAEPIDDEGCFIIDYSIYDALISGIDDIVIVIKKEMEHDFREILGKRIENKARITYAFQETAERVKPWGTAHAVLSARTAVTKPFIVINSDDFYGRPSYTELARVSSGIKTGECAMAGYKLGMTLSETGGVSRAVCDTDPNDFLTRIEEHTGLERSGDIIKGFNAANEPVVLPPACMVSLNFWCFHNTVFEALSEGFNGFLNNLPKELELKAEYYLPSFVLEEINAKRLQASLIRVDSRWHGITYRDDLESLKNAIVEYKRQGIYPERLWDNESKH